RWPPSSAWSTRRVWTPAPVHDRWKIARVLTPAIFHRSWRPARSRPVGGWPRAGVTVPVRRGGGRGGRARRPGPGRGGPARAARRSGRGGREREGGEVRGGEGGGEGVEGGEQKVGTGHRRRWHGPQPRRAQPGRIELAQGLGQRPVGHVDDRARRLGLAGGDPAQRGQQL